MQILKGAFLGVGIFLVLSILYFLFGLRYQLGIPKGAQFAVDIRVIKAMTLTSPVFWIAFAACLVVSVNRRPS
jgi:ABC-type antimicrobial peptide transport system permease subunit